MRVSSRRPKSPQLRSRLRRWVLQLAITAECKNWRPKRVGRFLALPLLGLIRTGRWRGCWLHAWLISTISTASKRPACVQYRYTSSCKSQQMVGIGACSTPVARAYNNLHLSKMPRREKRVDSLAERSMPCIKNCSRRLFCNAVMLCRTRKFASMYGVLAWIVPAKSVPDCISRTSR